MDKILELWKFYIICSIFVSPNCSFIFYGKGLPHYMHICIRFSQSKYGFKKLLLLGSSTRPKERFLYLCQVVFTRSYYKGVQADGRLSLLQVTGSCYSYVGMVADFFQRVYVVIVITVAISLLGTFFFISLSKVVMEVTSVRASNCQHFGSSSIGCES